MGRLFYKPYIFIHLIIVGLSPITIFIWLSRCLFGLIDGDLSAALAYFTTLCVLLDYSIVSYKRLKEIDAIYSNRKKK